MKAPCVCFLCYQGQNRAPLTVTPPGPGEKHLSSSVGEVPKAVWGNLTHSPMAAAIQSLKHVWSSE